MTSVNPAILSKAWRQRGKPGLVQVSGFSMQPLIGNKMWLMVQPCNHREVQPGDIGLFHQECGLVAHRIIFMKNLGDKMYLGHKGDNAFTIETVSSGCLMGKVLEVNRPDGALNLEDGYWRVVNRWLGRYYAGLWALRYRAGKKKTLPGNLYSLPFSFLNKHFLRLIVRIGCWTGRGINKEPSWNRLAQACIAPSPVLPLRLPTEDMEWEKFLKIARDQHIQRLCYKFLKDHRKKVPANIISGLAKSSHAVGFRNLKIIDDAVNLIKTLKDAGIDVIILKGVALLACQIYSNPAERKMNDLDILVKKQDLPRAEAILQNMGYQTFDTVFNITSLSLDWCCRYYKELNYLKHGLAGYMADVHWNIDSNFHIPNEELWQRSQKINLNGLTIVVLSPEDMLLHICLHTVSANDHLVRDLRPWADLARIVQLDLNWSQIVDCAQRYRIERALYVALYLAHKFAEAKIPLEVLAGLRRACPRMLIWWLEKQTALLELQRPILTAWWCLRLISGWRGKVHYLRSNLFRMGALLFLNRGELSLLYNFDPDSSYLKYLLIHQKYILVKALMKRIAHLKR